MREIVNVKSSEIFPLVREMLDAGQGARIVVTGTSMYPFLREFIDSVELVKASYQNMKHSDIVLIMRENGEYILHRVIRKKTDEFYIIGDNQNWIEGPLRPGQLIAVVRSVWRKGKNIECSNILWRILSGVWLSIIPMRGMINRFLRHFNSGSQREY